MVSFNCHCPERDKPASERRWRVTQRHSRCSAFDGYRHMWSPYSAVICLACRACGRTNALYVALLPDFNPEKDTY